MKKALFSALICLCAALYSYPARASYVTGNDLMVSCQGEKPGSVLGCLNYIAGVIDYHVMLQSLGTAPSMDFCLPATLPVEKAAVVVLRYLKKSPQHGPFIAAPAVMMALHETYPCGPPPQKKKKRKHG